MERLLTFYCIEECRVIAKEKLVGQSIVPNSGDHIPIHGKEYRVVLRKMPPAGVKGQFSYVGSIEVVVAPVNHTQIKAVFPAIAEWVFEHNAPLHVGSVVSYTPLEEEPQTLIVVGVSLNQHGDVLLALNGTGNLEDYTAAYSEVSLSEIRPS